MAHSTVLVKNLRKDHHELFEMMASFKEAIDSSDKKSAKKIVQEINSAVDGHFKFEESYLYPRLKRLMSEMTEKLRGERQEIKKFIEDSKYIVSKNRLDKSELSSFRSMFSMVTKHLKDCDDLVLLANKFRTDEGDELNVKFRECCKKGA